jgi:rhamnogalacturonan endolyase
MSPIHRKLGFEQLESRQVLSAVTLNPVADTYTRAGVNAGAAATLETRDLNGAAGDYMAYLRFDLSGVDLTGLTNAYLTLQKVGGATIVIDRFDVFGLANLAGNTPQNWNEATLANSGLGAEYTNTGGNYVDLTRVVNLSGESTSGANVIEQVSGSGSPQHLSGVDVVTFLQQRKDDGGLATFIALVDAGQDRNLIYGSRENADPDLRPILKLVYTPEYPEAPVVMPRQLEYLDRGLIAMRRATGQVYLGWRMLGTDPADISFNVYRSANGSAAVQLNATPISNSTNFVDTTFNATATNVYHVRPIVNGVELGPSESFTLAANAPLRQYLNVPLQIPPGGQQPDFANPGQFVSYTYTANDASIGDLDGDGQYEVVLKWMPTNEAHAGADGFTGPMIFDAYNLDGTLLWRVNLGINIRSAPQYSPFLVFDFDGDGKAEFVSRTAPGTKDGLGADVILAGDDPNIDYRNSSGRVLTGPEYLTVFDGETGAELATVPFLPDRQDISTWGDDYGHRGESMSMAVAYVDGVRPSIIVGRGIYGPQSSSFSARNELTAWNWREDELTNEWWFKSAIGINDNINSEYIGQGTHGIAVADADGDGKDEIIFGGMTVDHDGTGLYSTGRGHGDALHVGDFDLSNPGLEVYQPHEDTSLGNHTAATLRDAATGRILAAPLVSPADVAAGSFPDVGRGIALDIDPNYPGYEFWNSYNPNIYDAQGNVIYAQPMTTGVMHRNFGVWWDADLLRETLDGTTISDWNYTTAGRSNLVSFSNSGINNSSAVSSNNGTKSTPTFSGDILGDWREEVIWRTSDNTALQIWSSTITSTNKIYTLTHDSLYRQALAWQNVGYNQPPNPSFFLGAGMATTLTPLIYTIPMVDPIPGDFNGDYTVDADDLVIWRTFYGETSTAFQPGDGDSDGDVDGRDFLVWQRNFGRTETPPVAPIEVALTTVRPSGRAFLSLGDLTTTFQGPQTFTDTEHELAELVWLEIEPQHDLIPVPNTTAKSSTLTFDEAEDSGTEMSEALDVVWSLVGNERPFQPSWE